MKATFYLILICVCQSQLVEQSMRWFPIQVITQSDDTLLLATTNEAIGQWNAISHRQLFQQLNRSTIPNGTSTCKIFFKMGNVDGGSTSMQYITNDPILTQTYARVTITMTRNVPVQRLKNIVLHELGHVLNLDHDEDQSSLMYWKLKDDIQYELNSPIKNKLLKSNKNLYC